MQRIAWLCAGMVAMLTGCAVPRPTPPVYPQPSVRHVVDRDYHPGEVRSAYVGEPVLRVKDYYVQSTEGGFYRLTAPLTYHFHPFGGTRSFPAGTPAQWVGSTTYEGASLRLVAIPDGDARMYPLLLDEHGRYAGLVYGTGGPFVPGKGKLVELEPAIPRLESTSTEAVSAAHPFLNYEVVYSGTDDRSINLLYREYTADNLARPAFTQQLTYAAGSDVIRFRNIRIRVLNATSEQLRYVVESD